MPEIRFKDYFIVDGVHNKLRLRASIGILSKFFDLQFFQNLRYKKENTKQEEIKIK